MDYDRFLLAETLDFADWLAGLDLELRLRVVRRVDDLRRGHVGRLAAVGRGIFELPVPETRGLLLYVQRTGPTLVVLMGGHASRRRLDANQALALAYWTDARTLHDRGTA